MPEFKNSMRAVTAGSEGCGGELRGAQYPTQRSLSKADLEYAAWTQSKDGLLVLPSSPSFLPHHHAWLWAPASSGGLWRETDGLQVDLGPIGRLTAWNLHAGDKGTASLP